MSRSRVAHFSPLLLSTLLGLPPAQAQAPADPLAARAIRLAAMSAVTGYEQAAGDTLLQLLPGAVRDPLGNIVRPGGASRRRLVACPLDEPGWVVGGIRPDGWLTLRRTPGPVAPLRDQQLEGARVTVLGPRGAVPGVVAVRSIHLTRQRGDLSTGPFTADSAFLDLGAASAAEVGRLGVSPLAPVTLAKRPHRYGDGLLAAPWAGRRGACAALLEAALGTRGEQVTVAFVVQHELSAKGLAAVARRNGPFEETLIVDAGQGSPGAAGPRPEDTELAARVTELGRVTRLTLPVRYAGSPVETVALTDVRALMAEIGGWIGGAP
ncbi:MAG TPA: hypothetical protein VFT84_10920 [Gemmatimonadales bacterium]|nr:hypothetical protein [Gemmatimonadales bacterium]